MQNKPTLASDVEKRFNEELTYWVVKGSTLNDGSERRLRTEMPEPIKHFLAQELERQRQEYVEAVEKLKIKNACPNCGSGGNEEIDQGVIDCHFCGIQELGEDCQYNQAITDVLAILKKARE